MMAKRKANCGVLRIIEITQNVIVGVLHNIYRLVREEAVHVAAIATGIRGSVGGVGNVLSGSTKM